MSGRTKFVIDCNDPYWQDGEVNFARYAAPPCKDFFFINKVWMGIWENYECKERTNKKIFLFLRIGRCICIRHIIDCQVYSRRIRLTFRELIFFQSNRKQPKTRINEYFET